MNKLGSKKKQFKKSVKQTKTTKETFFLTYDAFYLRGSYILTSLKTTFTWLWSDEVTC